LVVTFFHAFCGQPIAVLNLASGMTTSCYSAVVLHHRCYCATYHLISQWLYTGTIAKLQQRAIVLEHNLLYLRDEHNLLYLRDGHNLLYHRDLLYCRDENSSLPSDVKFWIVVSDQNPMIAEQIVCRLTQCLVL
jgi:hypothetical protein